jgi:D-alanine-D-alanine ligase
VSRVAVLSGGRSSEHDVSLASGEAVRGGLARAGHEVLDVRIERDGRWWCDERAVTMAPGEGLLDADVAFPVLHGPFGEDGTVQGLLECLDVPYVGAGVLASALCMDKVLFKELMARHGVPQVDYRRVDERIYRVDPGAVLEALEELGRPVFVKPARLGSSVGIVRVSEGGLELANALEVAFGHDAQAIVEVGASGLEVECSVLGHRAPEASTPGEIVVKRSASPGGWYDYEAKYTEGGMELVVPPRISAAARERVRELAVAAFTLAGVSGLARVDFFVEGEDVLVNELNTMPGFTETSVYAKLWAESGVPFPHLVDRLVALGIERHAEERAYRH